MNRQQRIGLAFFILGVGVVNSGTHISAKILGLSELVIGFVLFVYGKD